ncbi:sulfite exporter TauE/SafE family protein [Lampropedia aestuarii]|uniref:Probable membrane transporter protein n=1 Tax=Lampropedia aestuarii TaxID=2562762 RepID=A0A4S5BUF9_9BURK|nr:sulfite exporter TauE/SafE family protein [Lampropedia aestuarii]MDH5859128.1 sulfite exporter TauE/SafE family protein [Lampropedia aestuarii]THJ36574.1 sulfite exporter TauE/SafE family protein [Lampropedia aestuarii]
MYWFLVLFGVLAGVTTALFGFGGGFVAVPVLYALLMLNSNADSQVAAQAMHIAVATSTCVMVFGAALATWRHQCHHTIVWGRVRPLLMPIALGAGLGAWGALGVDGIWMRRAFIAYLALTILDGLLRRGFMHTRSDSLTPLGPGATWGLGAVIGAVAAGLGVGGSVMTVPLMRRRGASMTAATAAANPLSLPVAIVGTITYACLARGVGGLDAWHWGYVDLRACMAMVAGSWLGIRASSRWIGAIPDAVHAKVYLGLLCLVLCVMVWA